MIQILNVAWRMERSLRRKYQMISRKGITSERGYKKEDLQIQILEQKQVWTVFKDYFCYCYFWLIFINSGHIASISLTTLLTLLLKALWHIPINKSLPTVCWNPLAKSDGGVKVFVTYASNSIHIKNYIFFIMFYYIIYYIFLYLLSLFIM